jgi:hypothetical protein
LAKENCQVGKGHQDKTDSINTEQLSAPTKSDGSGSRKCLSKITDIDYLEIVNEQHQQVRGGNLDPSLESNSLKSEWLLSNDQGFSGYN